MALTPEQKTAVEAVREGRSLKIEAVAGSGKTHTLAAAARRRLPADTRVMTLNALAFRAVVQGSSFGAKWKGGHVGVATAVRRYGDMARPYTRAALGTLERFFNSADPSPGPEYGPSTPEKTPQLQGPDRRGLRRARARLVAALR